MQIVSGEIPYTNITRKRGKNIIKYLLSVKKSVKKKHVGRKKLKETENTFSFLKDLIEPK